MAVGLLLESREDFLMIKMVNGYIWPFRKFFLIGKTELKKNSFVNLASCQVITRENYFCIFHINRTNIVSKSGCTATVRTHRFINKLVKK